MPRGYYPRPSLEMKFWKHVQTTEGCWNWMGTKRSGYGRLSVAGRWIAAHRLSYQLLKGEIPSDKELDHLCHNPSCVNPEHLEAVTHGENLIRGNTINRKNAQKTHCPRGHLLAGKNLLPSKEGWRQCRTCHNEHRKGLSKR